jgi:hypothetical protein
VSESIEVQFEDGTVTLILDVNPWLLPKDVFVRLSDLIEDVKSLGSVKAAVKSPSTNGDKPTSNGKRGPTGKRTSWDAEIAELAADPELEREFAGSTLSASRQLKTKLIDKFPGLSVRVESRGTSGVCIVRAGAYRP